MNSCSEHKELFVGPGYQVVYYSNPVNLSETGNVIWKQVSPIWNISLLVSIGLRIPTYLAIATLCVLLLVKNGGRFHAKTFPVIYTCITVLGISRVLFLLFDPYGISGWIADRWFFWVICSRLLAVVGIPALTTSYTLIFLTLWKSSDMNASHHWYNKWKVIVSIIAVYFSIAVSAEIIANSVPDPTSAIVVIIVCEVFFSFWGLTMCVMYLIAGSRLIRTIKRQVMRSSKVSATDVKKNTMEYNKNISKKAPVRVIRKILYITYGTAILGVLYSLVNAGTLILKIYMVHLCFGFHGQVDPIIWLCIEIISKVLEIALAINIIYSVTNTNRIIKTVKSCFKKQTHNSEPNNNMI